MEIFRQIIDYLTAIALFANALLFVPQAWRIYQKKHAKDISLVTFTGFLAIIAIITVHAVLNRDYPLLIGYVLSMISCGAVVILALIYRKN